MENGNIVLRKSFDWWYFDWKYNFSILDELSYDFVVLCHQHLKVAINIKLFCYLERYSIKNYMVL